MSAPRRPLFIASLLFVAPALAGCSASGSPDLTDPAPAAYSASPECDAYVATRNDVLSSANQQAVQVSVDELPFDIADGIGYNVFAMSPDLTYRSCETNEPMGCFTDAAGNLVVVGGADAALPFFPGLNAIVIGGVHMIGD